MTESPAALTTRPSSTIPSCDAGNEAEIRTVKCTWTWPPAGMVRPVHLTFGPDAAPPLSAETNVVLFGIGSVMETDVAAALPMFLTVIV